MGLPVYYCSKHLATDWWRIVEMGGFRVERYATAIESAVAGEAMGLGAMVSVMSRVETGGIASVLCPSILMMCGGSKNERELLASLERTFLASRATLGHRLKPLACKRLLRCLPTLVQAWPRVLQDGQTDIRPSDEPVGALAIETAPIPYRYGSVCRSGATCRMFTGPALDPDLGEVTAHLALDY